MIALARGVLYSEILLTTLYIVSFKLTFVRLIGVSLIMFVMIFNASAMGKIKQSTKVLMRWAFALVSLRFLVDSTIHYTDIYEPLNHFLRQSVVIMMLPVFEKLTADRVNPIRTIFIAAIPACLLGFLQLVDPGFTIPEMLPNNSILITEGITQSYIRAESRIVGPFSIAIGFAMFLGILAMMVWSRGLMGKMAFKPLSLLVLILVAILIVATQTRSAIYGIFPALIAAYLMSDTKRVGRWIVAAVGVGVLVIGYSGYEAFIVKQSSRSALNMDANTYYKLTANLYGTYAALKRDPLFGVATFYSDGSFASEARTHRAQKELIKEGYTHLGIDVPGKGQFGLVATNHNMLAYYLRHYGLVGFSILLVMLWKMHRKIANKIEIRDRFMLYGVLFYFLQYSLLHNSEILETLLIWALLSVGREKEEEFQYATDNSAAMRIQRA